MAKVRAKASTRIALIKDPEKGDKGEKGPANRIRIWKAGMEFEPGTDGYEFKDYVFYNGQFYGCLKYIASSATNPYASVQNNTGEWRLETRFDFIATSVLYIGDGEGWIIDKGVIKHSSGKIQLKSDGSFETSNGKFKVDVDGKIYAEDGTFKGVVKADSGYIGGFELDDSWLRASGINYGALISAATIQLFANAVDLIDSKITSDFEVHPYPLAYMGFYIMERLVSAMTTSAADYNANNRANILMYLSATGQKKATYDNSGMPHGGNFAAWCEGGMFAGLRPHLRHVSTSITLANTDNTIIVNNSSSITITLPSNPEIGQEYEIWHTTATNLTIQTQNVSTRKYIYCMTKNSSYGYSHASGACEVVRFKFAHGLYHNSSSENGMWLMIYYGKNA